MKLPVLLALLACSTPHAPEPPRLGATFYFELGGLYERNGVPELAEAQLVTALDRTKDLAVILAVDSALGRVREARGDDRGAIEALVAARQTADAITRNQGGTPPAQGALLYVDERDLAERLGRLYVKTNQPDAGDRVYASLAATGNPYERDRVLLERIDGYRRAGTLATRVAEWERAGDEPALRFLVVYGGDGLAGPSAAGPIDPAQREHTLQQLAKLVPGDTTVRDALLASYERVGDAAAALALVHTDAPPDACPTGAVPVALPHELEAIEHGVESLVRMSKPGDAVALIATLPDTVDGNTLAARLYWPLDKAALGDAALAKAAKQATTLEQRRTVEKTTAFGLERAQKTGALSALYQAWQRGDDPCLRTEGTYGLAQWASVSPHAKASP